MQNQFQSLLDLRPDLAKEWHPTKNGILTPQQVYAQSGKYAWWYLPYDDPNTGKHFDFEWRARIQSRTRGAGCPYLSGKAVWPGFNDLTTINPNLANEWHPTKNNGLSPSDVTANSAINAWWLVHYDDPVRGSFDFEWQAPIYSRNSGIGCPFLANKAVWPTFNDLATTHPDIAGQWHYEKNGNLTPQDVTGGSHLSVWWILKHYDVATGEHIFEWKAMVADRVAGDGCPYLSGHKLMPEYNSIGARHPELIDEWDNVKNGCTVFDVINGSCKHAWWKCQNGHSWKARIDSRTDKGAKCPHCTRSLKTSLPEQTVFYYVHKAFPDAISGYKFGVRSELDIYIPTLKTAIEYDGAAWHQYVERDVAKNIQCDNIGVRLIRIREHGCPIIQNPTCTIFNIAPYDTLALGTCIRQILSLLGIEINVDIENDMPIILSQINYAEISSSLICTNPKLAAEWHPTKNGNLGPQAVKATSGRVVWWMIKHIDEATGKEFEFEWQAVVADRARKGYGCPYLSGTKIHPDFNSLAALNPALAADWNIEKNQSLVNKKGEDVSTPDKVSPGSHMKVWWKCSRCNHEWVNTIERRSLGVGCPECKKSSRQSTKIKQSDIEL